jgi:hypothetical protein
MMSSGTVPIRSVLMQSIGRQARVAMLPGESPRPCPIGMMATSTGDQIARCRRVEILRGQAPTSGPQPCDRALKFFGRNAVPSVGAFTSAAVDGVGSEQRHNLARSLKKHARRCAVKPDR